MIRINLLTVERKAVKRAAVGGFDAGQKITVGCTAVLILAMLFVGWRYWSLQQESNRLDKAIADAQQETARLRAIIVQVQAFEQQKAALQERVTLIEQLRDSQTGPVHMLDEISRALPPMLWLTELKQTADNVVIDGRCTGLTRLSDFVANLEASGYFQKSIEIVSSQAETVGQAEIIKFSVKARFQQPGGAPKS